MISEFVGWIKRSESTVILIRIRRRKLENLWHIISKPDNVPIIGLIVLLVFFTWLAFSQAFEHDRRSEEGKK
jgi:hypothetical protein